MGLSRRKIIKVSKGQISSELIERTELGILDESCQELTNWTNTKYGAIKTVSGTVLKYTFGANKKVKILRIILPNNQEGLIAFNGTDGTIAVFDYLGNLLSNIYQASVFTESNVNDIQIAQNQDLILVCTGDNPIIKLELNLPNINASIFSIPAKKILKASNISVGSLSPVLLRLGNDSLPDDALSYGLNVGDIVYPNSGTGNPNTTFPWNAKKLLSYADDTHWTVTAATINSLGSNLQTGNTITYQHGSLEIKFTVNNVKVGASLGIVSPETTYSEDPAGENLQINSNVTIDIVTEPQTITAPKEETIEDEDEEITVYKITSAKINSLVNQYQEGDVLNIDGESILQIQTVQQGSSLLVLDKEKMFSENPTNGTVTGGNGTGITLNISSATIPTKWEDYSFTPNELDVIRDKWNSANWQYSQGKWIQPSLSAQDLKYTSKWRANAASGTIKITGTGTLLSLTAPTGIDPKTYAESMLCGVKFDGDDAIGIMIITELTGTTTGQRFDVKTLTGSTVITFDSTVTTKDQTGFTIKFSQTKVFDGDYPNTNNNPTATTNYPMNILFYQQRLIIAGTAFNKSQLIFSQLGVYDDFTDEQLSDSAFQLVIGSTEKEEIRSVLVNQGIQIFTSNNEWLMNEQAITRSSGFTRNSSIGTNGVKPIISANGTTLFPPKNGKGIIGFTYNYESASFATPYVSLFTDLLDSPVADLALKKSADSTDDVLLFICNEDGEMVIANYLQEHEIQAFCARKSQVSKFKQAVQCEDRVLILTDRNGITSLELLDETKNTSAGISSGIQYSRNTGVLTVPNAQYDGLPIGIYDGNGNFVGSYVVNNDSVTIPEDKRPQSVSEYGYVIESKFASNPINIGNETKALHKTINTIKLAVTPESKTDYLTVCGKKGHRIGDLVVFVRPARPLRDCRFTIENKCYPVTILSMELDVEA